MFKFIINTSQLLYSLKLCLFQIQVEAKFVWVHIKRFAVEVFQERQQQKNLLVLTSRTCGSAYTGRLWAQRVQGRGCGSGVGGGGGRLWTEGGAAGRFS